MKNLFFKVSISSLNGANYHHTRYFKQKKVLDLGCGSGDFLSLDNKNFYGVDTNTEAINHDSFNLKILQANATSLPFHGYSFQSVRINNIIEHLCPPSAYQLLKEASRVLKNKGHMIIHTQMANRRSWETFSHARPYPPTSILNITSDALNKEDYPRIPYLKPISIYYEGPFHPNKLIFGFITTLANYTPFFKRDYTLVLQKTR